MKNKIINVYLHNNKRVVLLGQNGDNFGYILDIDKNEVLTTYGYNSITFNNKTRIGTNNI